MGFLLGCLAMLGLSCFVFETPRFVCGTEGPFGEVGICSKLLASPGRKRPCRCLKTYFSQPLWGMIFLVDEDGFL